MKINKLIKYVIFYIIIFLIVATLFKLDRDNKINSYLKKQTADIYLEFKTINKIYKKFSEQIFESYIRQDEIISIIENSSYTIKDKKQKINVILKNISLKNKLLFNKLHIKEINIYLDKEEEKNRDIFSFIYSLLSKEKNQFFFEIKFDVLNIIKEIAYTYKTDFNLRLGKNFIEEVIEKKSFSTYSKENFIIHSFIPLKNPQTNKIIAYIEFSKEDNFIENKFTNSYFLTLMTMLLITALFIYIKELNKAKAILDYKIKKEVGKNRKKDLQLLNQAKMISVGEILNNIAHQWRQPLSIITTSASGLKLERELNSLDDKNLDMYINHIISQSDYLSKTIESFKDFIDEEKEATHKICIQDKINDSLKLVQSVYFDENIKIYKNFHEQNVYINSSLGDFTQVILNILNNAKDAIKLANRKDKFIIVSIFKKKLNCIITIEDTGTGINKNIINNIFEPYFTTKHKSMGTGIGLYISYETVVHKLKGVLKARNTKNGSKFIIKIPLDETMN